MISSTGSTTRVTCAIGLHTRRTVSPRERFYGRPTSPLGRRDRAPLSYIHLLCLAPKGRYYTQLLESYGREITYTRYYGPHGGGDPAALFHCPPPHCRGWRWRSAPRLSRCRGTDTLLVYLDNLVPLTTPQPPHQPYLQTTAAHAHALP